MKIRAGKRSYSPKKFTTEVMKKVVADIAKGATIKHAALANGISERHFFNMWDQGMIDLESDQVTIGSQLVQLLTEVEMKEIQSCRQRIRENEKSHKGAEWTLEKAYSSYYGNDLKYNELAEEIRKLKHEAQNEREEKRQSESGSHESSKEDDAS